MLPTVHIHPRTFLRLVSVLAIALTVPGCGKPGHKGFSGGTVELTKADAATFGAAKSTQMTIFGLHLGMTRGDAETLLADSSVVAGVPNEYNPTWIDVRPRSDGTGKEDPILYLVWEPSKSGMQSISVFPGMRPYLNPDLQRLLTSEVFSATSLKKRRMIGYSNRSQNEVVGGSINHTHYFYDAKGMRVTKTRYKDGEDIMFSLIFPKE